ncbi:hypothetical protein [Lysinibacillus fusiformis]|uniref:hypothetical protein n=2 Tax=Bacillati TaxID=1783272 RepID=UPI00371676F0
MITTMVTFLSSIIIAILLLVLFSVLGAVEGVIEEYFKFVDKKAREFTANSVEQGMVQQEETSFWTKQRLYRFLYKFVRMIVILTVLCVSFYSVLQVVMVYTTDGDLKNINWNFVFLIPAFKIYKAFTKVMSDVMNGTDEAASDASKVNSGYETAFRLYENLRAQHSSSTTETEKETKKPDQ